MAIPALIGAAVDDGSHTAYQLAILVSQEILGFATFKRGILIMAKGCHLIEIQIRHGKRVTTIQIIIKLNERLQFAATRDRTYFHHFVPSNVRMFFLVAKIIQNGETTKKTAQK